MNIEQLREFALSLPAATEDVKWGNDLCFCIGEKMFCVTGLSGSFGASLKVKNEEFEELCSRDGIIPAPYMARYKWIAVEGDALSDKEWEHYVRQSYQIISSKLTQKVKQELGLLRA